MKDASLWKPIANKAEARDFDTHNLCHLFDWSGPLAHQHIASLDDCEDVMVCSHQRAHPRIHANPPFFTPWQMLLQMPQLRNIPPN
jgi:hypothetical protein